MENEKDNVPCPPVSSDQNASGVAVQTRKAKPDRKNKPASLPPYNVVLLNDDDHTHEYVVEMLRAIFAYPHEAGYRMAQEVDRRGRVVVLTTHKEKAELKCEQIHSYGGDHRVATCKGSMSAYIEPAEAGEA